MLRIIMYSFLLLLLPVLSIAQAQQATEQQKIPTEEQFLTDKDGIRISGFLSSDTEFSSIGNNFAVGSGGSIALIFNRSLYFGLYGMGVVFDIPNLDFDININDVEELDSLNNFNFKALGHGGLLIGGVFQPHKIVHGGASIKLGYGDLAMFDNDKDLVTNDFTFIISPQIEAEVNVARWFKIKAAGGYRFATDLRTDLFYDKNYVNSPTGSISLIFGWFGEHKIFDKKEKQKSLKWFKRSDRFQKRKLHRNKDDRQIDL